VQYPGSTGGSGLYSGKVQPNQYLGDQMMAYIAADTPFSLENVGDGQGSIVNPNAPAPAPAPTGTAGATATAAPVAEDLPVLDIRGQNAADYTCSVTNNY
jgi:hypothetical protein